jgi:hypothetical protein
MKKYLYSMAGGLAIGFLLSMVQGCKTVEGCQVQANLVEASTFVISNSLGCKKPEEMKPYVEKLVKQLNLCQSRLRSMARYDFCSAIVEEFISMGLRTLPPEAECDGGIVLETLRDNKDIQEAIIKCDEMFF